MLTKETREHLEQLCRDLREQDRRSAASVDKVRTAGFRIPHSKRIGVRRGPGSVIRYRLTDETQS